MRKKIMTLMMGALLLLTACGQTGSNSASTMLSVAAVQSTAQAIAPMENKMQEDVDSLPAEEGGFTVRRVEGAELLELLAIYFEQDATHEAFDLIDGAHWLTAEMEEENADFES